MKFRKFFNLSITLLVALSTMMIIISCPSIVLIAPYDERIESGITNLQKNTTEFFVKIERQEGSDKNDYKNYIEFYDNSKVATKSLLIRTGATAHNKLTTKQIEILIQKYKSLEKQHKTIGLTPYTTAGLEKGFDQVFRAIITLEVAKKGLTEKKKGE